MIYLPLTKEAYMRTYQCNLVSNLNKWLKRKSRKINDEHLDAALALLILDLEPARKYMQALYSTNPRGRPPYDPICMLRALLLMILLGFKSYTLWSKELRNKPRLSVIAGFASHSKEHADTPSVGCFYDFFERLENGKYQKPCQHYVKPSKLRKGKHLRNIAGEKEIRQKEKEADIAKYDSITKKLKDELNDNKDRPRPNDLLKMLEDILISCAIIPSAKRGILGDTSKLNLCGDGSALPSALILTASHLVNVTRTVYTNAITIDTILMLLLTGDMILTVNATTSDILTTSTSSTIMVTTYPCTSALLLPVKPTTHNL